MHSSRSALLAIVLAACGTDVDPPAAPDPRCATSTLTYDNFGAPFVLDWCRGCHSSALPEDMRQDAPVDVNFDDLIHIRQWADAIELHATGAAPNMPPASGPSDEERDMLQEWIRCGVH